MSGMQFESDIKVAGALASAPAVRAESTILRRVERSFARLGTSSPTGAPAAPGLPGAAAGSEGEMIDREARVVIEVKDVAAATEATRTLANAHDARVTLENRNEAEYPEVNLQVRVPLAAFDAFFAGLVALGDVRGRELQARDVSLEIRDTDLLLRNLEALAKRYEELLARATDVKDMLAIEKELDRVRTNIDRTKAHALWLRDRVARGTIAVRFFASRPSERIVTDSTFYPGVRGSALVDFREGESAVGYAGLGLSFRLLELFGSSRGSTTRGAVFDIDVARKAFGASPRRSDYAFNALVGGDYYSALLGGGARRFLNPYIGFRVGVFGTQGRGDLALGVVLGLELVKTKWATLDVQARGLGLLGNPDGVHAAVQPSLGANFAF